MRMRDIGWIPIHMSGVVEECLLEQRFDRSHEEDTTLRGRSLGPGTSPSPHIAVVEDHAHPEEGQQVACPANTKRRQAVRRTEIEIET